MYADYYILRLCMLVRQQVFDSYPEDLRRQLHQFHTGFLFVYVINHPISLIEFIQDLCNYCFYHLPIGDCINIDEMQFGFMPGRGTSDAIIILRQLEIDHLFRIIAIW